MDIVARPAQGRAIAEGDFADITTAAVTSIDWAEGGNLRVSFDGDLTQAQQLRVRLRITSCDATDEALRAAAAAYLTVDAPTAAQATAQVKRLTRLLLTLNDG